MTEERYISWEEVTNGCISLVVNNILTLNEMEAVVGMSDDMIPATIIANLLKIPVVPVIDRIIFENKVVNYTSINKPLQSGEGKLPPQVKLLVVGSKTNIESHLMRTVEIYQQRGHEVSSLALFDCSDCGHKPDLYWRRATELKTKLMFPWEL